MTRINVVPPEELCDQHLVAEYRELTRIPRKVASSPSTVLKSIEIYGQAKDYILGPGHVRFFYDKLTFLRKRYVALMAEMKARGFETNKPWPVLPYETKDLGLWGDYTPTAEALALNRQRIAERVADMKRKPRHTQPSAYQTVYVGQKPKGVTGALNHAMAACEGWRPMQFDFLRGCDPTGARP